MAFYPWRPRRPGGGNGAGAFGSGAAENGGNNMAFSLADSGPGGGSASYLISAANYTLTDLGAPVPVGTTFGAYISIGGLVPLVGNADVVSLIRSRMPFMKLCLRYGGRALI